MTGFARGRTLRAAPPSAYGAQLPRQLSVRTIGAQIRADGATVCAVRSADLTDLYTCARRAGSSLCGVLALISAPGSAGRDPINIAPEFSTKSLTNRQFYGIIKPATDAVNNHTLHAAHTAMISGDACADQKSAAEMRSNPLEWKFQGIFILSRNAPRRSAQRLRRAASAPALRPHHRRPDPRRWCYRVRRQIC